MLPLLFLVVCASVKSESTTKMFEEVLASEYVEEIFRYLGPNSLLKNYKVLNSSDCARDLSLLEETLIKRKLWALKMLDASSKIPSGIVEGNIVDLGAFDQCIGIQAEINDIQIKGRHCMYKINPIKKDSILIVKPTMSICVPASCSANDIILLANSAMEEAVKLKNIGISIASAHCTQADSKLFTSEFLIFNIIIAVYIGFLFLCTVCDLINRQNIAGGQVMSDSSLSVSEKPFHINFQKESYVGAIEEVDLKESAVDQSLVIDRKCAYKKAIHSIRNTILEKSKLKSKQEQFLNLHIDLQKTLSRFSIIKCSEAVLTLDSRVVNLPVVNGIRFISAASIILFHSYFVSIFSGNINFLRPVKWMGSWTSVIFVNTPCAVDTLFTLSGFLLTFTSFKKIQEGHFKILGHYLHRYLRLTPPAAISACLSIFLARNLIFGPQSEVFIDIFSAGFHSKWQYSLLYIQNFVDLDDYRMQHFWSLCVDMQLFWVSPLILYALYLTPKIGLAILAIIIAACQILTASIYAINEYPFFYFNKEMNLTFALEGIKSTYAFPYTRASPWLLGILLGFIIYRNLKPSKLVVRWVWLSWIVISIGSYFSIKHAVIHRDFIFFRDVIIFALFLRPTWSLFICWIIYTSHHDCAGPIARFLSWEYFLPLSRISYSMYLIHLLPISLRSVSSKVQLYFSDYLILHSYISDMVLCVIGAFLFSVIFEVPVLIFDKMVFGDREKTEKKSL